MIAHYSLLFALFLVGCSPPKIEYRPIPAYLIPQKPDLISIGSDEVPQCHANQKPCMTDDTYAKFVKNDRALKLQIDELRALLGVSQ